MGVANLLVSRYNTQLKRFLKLRFGERGLLDKAHHVMSGIPVVTALVFRDVLEAPPGLAQNIGDGAGYAVEWYGPAKVISTAAKVGRAVQVGQAISKTGRVVTQGEASAAAVSKVAGGVAKELAEKSTTHVSEALASVLEHPQSTLAQAERGILQDPRQVAGLSLNQELSQASRVGSGLKDDVTHRSASFATQLETTLHRFDFIGDDGKKYILFQRFGQLNNESGIYEYIQKIDGTITHQRFIRNGIITGKPNQR